MEHTKSIVKLLLPKIKELIEGVNVKDVVISNDINVCVDTEGTNIDMFLGEHIDLSDNNAIHIPLNNIALDVFIIKNKIWKSWILVSRNSLISLIVKELMEYYYAVTENMSKTECNRLPSLMTTVSIVEELADVVYILIYYTRPVINTYEEHIKIGLKVSNVNDDNVINSIVRFIEHKSYNHTEDDVGDIYEIDRLI